VVHTIQTYIHAIEIVAYDVNRVSSTLSSLHGSYFSRPRNLFFYICMTWKCQTMMPPRVWFFFIQTHTTTPTQRPRAENKRDGKKRGGFTNAQKRPGKKIRDRSTFPIVQGLPVDLVASHLGIFMVPCSLRCLCMSKAFHNKCGSWPQPLRRHSNSARSR
jgi:hypothetical protein